MEFAWNNFSIFFYYPISTSEVFRAWATAKGLKSFFIEDIQVIGSDGHVRGENEVFQSGDHYNWRWRHDYSARGKFYVVRPDLVFFSFGSMDVSIYLRQVGQQCELKLVQENIPVDEKGKSQSHMNCRICWTFFLTNLKSVLIHHADLRDVDPSRASSYEVGFLPKY